MIIKLESGSMEKIGSVSIISALTHRTFSRRQL